MSLLAALLAFLGSISFLAAGGVFYARLFRVSRGWGVASVVFPPAGAVAFLTYSRKHPLDALAIVVGLYVFVFFTLLWARLNPLHPLLDGVPQVRQWLAPAAVALPRYEYAFPRLEPVKPGQLTAMLDGKPQRAMTIEWIGDTLKFAEGGDPHTAITLQVRFPEGWKKDPNYRHLVIAPTQLDAPVVEVYSPTPTGRPDIVVLKKGYWLHLDIDDSQPRIITGRVQLLLPNHYRTWINGAFAAYTESVRYIDGEIDRNFDSAETLARIAVSHVNSYLWRWIEGTPNVSRVRFQTQYDPLDGVAMVTASLGLMGKYEIPVDFRKGDSGWYVVPDAAPIIAMNLELQSQPAAAGTAMKSGSSANSMNEPLVIERFSALRRYIGASGVVFTIDGRKMEGTVLAVEGDQLKLRRALGRNQLTVIVSSHNFVKFVQVE